MDVAHQLILLGSGLIALSIVVGLLSSRFGAPLLLVFLALGMLAGEDGPGGIDFDDFHTAYLVGSIALAIILFDGGLRTDIGDFRSAFAPAAVLATVGVVVTALVTGAAAKWLLDIGWVEGMLVGSIVASTDAAAVFLLLNLRGLRLKHRVRSTLEVEAGLNDPMALFLTIACVEFLTLAAGEGFSAASVERFALRFLVQAAGGIAIGTAGGYLMLAIVNRLAIASGLYPVLAVSCALLIFAGAQEIGASGFLAVYLAGLVFGHRRHRATQIINRFHDGLAWLSQIAMFLILGLLVTPSALLPTLLPALAIAAVLIFVARPVMGLFCLPLFGFDRRENGFISWVGLRGAVPIYLGTIPVLSGLPGAQSYFEVVFVVVIASLVVQGWTIGVAARRLGMVLPPRPAVPPRVDIDLPVEVGRDMMAYTVQPSSLALRRPLSRLPLPAGTDIVSVVRDGAIRMPQGVDRLAPADYVLLLAAAEHAPVLDRLFGRKEPRGRGVGPALLGEFVFSAETATGAIADAYDFRVPVRCRDEAVGSFLARNLPGRPAMGRRLRVGPVELVVREMAESRIATVAIELDPDDNALRRAGTVWIWVRAMLVDPLIRGILAPLRGIAGVARSRRGRR